MYFDGPIGVAFVRVTNDICQRLVDPEHHGTAFGLGESQPLRELRHRAAHRAKRLRITAQFHFQQQIAPVQGVFSSGLGNGTRGEIVMRQLCRFFCKIESSPEVSAQEPHFAVHIPLQDGLAVLVRKLAMNVNRSLPLNCCYIAGHLAAFLEPPNRAAKYDQVRCRGSIAVAIAVHVLEPALFLKLLDQILIERKLEVRGQFDLVRLNHQNLNRRRFHCLRRRRLSAEFRQLHLTTQQQQPDTSDAKNALHGFFSFVAAGLVSELPPSSCIGMLVRAPCATISFLSASALPVAIVKMAPCNPPSASRYWIDSVSTLERNRLRNRPPP